MFHHFVAIVQKPGRSVTLRDIEEAVSSSAGDSYRSGRRVGRTNVISTWEIKGLPVVRGEMPGL